MSSPMLLVVDIGNTNVTLGVFRWEGGRGQLLHHWRTGSHRDRTSDEVGIVLRALFDQSGLSGREITDVIVSCVVPPLLPIWERVCEKLFHREPLVIGPGIRTGMPVRYENPREVGADRIVNSVAAFELFGGPIIAVDFGTATTFDCVSSEGEYLGGAIFPGIGVSMDALFSRAALLHRVELVRPKQVIGRTTTTSLQAGLLFGYAGMVDAMVARIRKELGADAHVIATGGFARTIAAESSTIERVEPHLTLEGLRILFEKNRADRGEVPRKETR